MTIEGPAVEARRDPEGWIFEANSRQTRPLTVEEMADVDFDEKVAGELGVAPRDVYKARLRIPETVKISVESQNPSVRFIAEAGLGPEVPASGFILFNDDEWIAAEATYLYGKLTEIKNQDTKHEEASETECLKPVLVYNQKDKRAIVLAEDSAFKLGPRVIRPTAKTLGSSGPQTLMSLDAIRQFLTGLTAEPSDLYAACHAGLKSFSNLSWDPRLYDVLVCLITATYFYDLFGAFPITVLRGAFRGGKTRLLLCITYMGHRGMAILDPSEASIFRTGEAWKPLLAIDEFYDVTREIERILRAAYKKGPRVPRVEKSKSGTMTLGLFDFYSKVVIATPEPVPSNIADKGITINMRRMADPHPEKRDPRPEDFEALRSMSYIARLTWPPAVKNIASTLDGEEVGLSGRDYEVWKPALTIAKLFGGTVWKNVLDYATESTEEKHEQSDDELKEVLQAVYDTLVQKSRSLLLGASPEQLFPVEFRPKELHDRIWERLKDDYRVTKEKQEVQGEASEKYDYDTHGFEKLYKVNRIGQTHLHQLGLKPKHSKKGSLYSIQSAQELHNLVIRYHPSLPDTEKDSYPTLVPSKKSSPSSPSSPEANSEREKTGDNPEAQTGGDNHVVTKDKSELGGDNQGRHPSKVVTLPARENEREIGLGDDRDNRDDISEVKPPFLDRGPCRICNEPGPLRLGHDGLSLICQPCFDNQADPQGGP